VGCHCAFWAVCEGLSGHQTRLPQWYLKGLGTPYAVGFGLAPIIVFLFSTSLSPP